MPFCWNFCKSHFLALPGWDLEVAPTMPESARKPRFGRRKKSFKNSSKFRCRNAFLDEGSKHHIRTMIAEGKSVSHCARVIRCDRKTVRNVQKSSFSRGTASQNFRPKHKFPKRDLTSRKKAVVKLALENDGDTRKYTSARSIADQLPFSCSPTTVRRYLREENIVSRVRPKRPRFKPSDIETRRNFSIQQLAAIQADPRRSYLFSDEKIFDTNERGMRRTWIERGTSAKPRFHQNWAPRVMVWGVVGFNFRYLHIFKDSERVTSENYVSKILPVIAKRVQLLKHHEVFIQDGARCHVSKHSMKFIEDNKIDAPSWPPRSPDLNVIENLWSLLERSIRTDRGDNTNSLRRAVRRAWNEIPTSTINDLVLGFSSRLVRCLENLGDFTQ